MKCPHCVNRPAALYGILSANRADWEPASPGGPTAMRPHKVQRSASPHNAAHASRVRHSAANQKQDLAPNPSLEI